MLGELTRPVYISRKTDFMPTPLYGDFHPISKVPSTKNGNPDPLLVGAFLFGSNLTTPYLDYSDSILNYLDRSYSSLPASVLSLSASMNTLGHMDRLNLNTSAGYPYVLNNQSKRTLFDINTDGLVTVIDPQYETYLQEYISSWESSYHEVIWIMSLKDCLDKDKKLCRVFEIPPVEYTLAVRAYYGSWIDMMQSTPSRTFSCIGINPESFEWTDLYHDLSKISEQGFDADVPSWDKCLLPAFLHLATDSVNRWYRINDPNWTCDHDHARHRLTYAMINAFLLVGPFLLRKHKGMASGWVLTALFNTICNMIMHLIWYMESAPLAIRDLAFYNHVICTKIYGDDSLDSVDYRYETFLNRVTMDSVYRRLCCMSVTSSLKNGTICATQPLSTTTFLKRGFRKDGFLIKPILSLRSLLSMISWVRKSKITTLDHQLLSNLTVLCQFSYFYGPQFYKLIRTYLLNSVPSFHPPSYQFYDNLFHKDQFVISLV